MKKTYKIALIFLIVPSFIAVFLFGSAEGSPPYPPSTVISGITWDDSTFVRKAPGSDNWASTWAADGNLYFTWGDGGGMGGTNSEGRVSLGVARIIGDPENFTAQNVWGGKNGENEATFDGKSLGILSVNGTLYMWRGPGSGWNAWEETWLAKSEDMGATWTLSSAPFFTYTDGFSKATFLNFGKNYAGARDNYVYIYAPDASAGKDVSQTKVSMARVDKAQIENRAAYEFFKGLDGDGNPQWTSDVGLRQAVFVDINGKVTDSPAVVYNAGLDRYLMCKVHDLSPTSGASGGVGIFDAPEPWGPWTTVDYTDDWKGSDNMYFCEFPGKWISADGLTVWMVFTGYGNDVIAKDAYQHMKGVFTLAASADTTPPTTPVSLSLSAVSNDTINLTWPAASDPESGILRYHIYRNGVFIDTATATAYSDGGLSEGSTYSYQVSAVNTAGLEGEKSSAVLGSTLADTTPPTLVSVSTGSDPQKVVVVFSETVEAASATNTGNYSINNGIALSGAVLAGDFKTVTLNTSPHSESVSYQLTVNNIRDRATVPNTILSGSTMDYTFSSSLVFSNLNAGSGKSYEVVSGGFENGVLVYIDRTYLYFGVIPVFNGGTYIKTANDDKGSSGASFLTFDVNQSVAVYVAHDNRITSKPAWLGSFTDIGKDVIIADQTHRLWRKDFSAGTVTLGGNEGASKSMYSVVVFKLGDAPVIDTIPPADPVGLSAE